MPEKSGYSLLKQKQREIELRYDQNDDGSFSYVFLCDNVVVEERTDTELMMYYRLNRLCEAALLPLQ